MPIKRQPVLAILLSVLLAAVAAPAVLSDEEYESENKATSVRPSARGKVLDASDVRAVAAAEGQKVTVRGKVHDVHVAGSKKVVKLNFGPDYKTCFTAAIFADSFPRWDGGTDGIRRSYLGKTVTLAGEVKMYQGLPEIVVRGPEDVKVLE